MSDVDLAVSKTKGDSVSATPALRSLDVHIESEWETNEIRGDLSATPELLSSDVVKESK